MVEQAKYYFNIALEYIKSNNYNQAIESLKESINIILKVMSHTIPWGFVIITWAC